MADKAPPRIELIAQNRRATYDFEIGERFEAGIALVGSEVKMLRNGKADLTDGWVNFQGEEAYLRGVNIPVMPGSPYSHEAKRGRKLLLHAREIEKLKRAVDRDGMTITVTKLYFKDGFAKVEIALARGKKKADKRESVKAKDADREARQAMARGRKGW
ncbi:MAG TPA: SsrA-binding protein SmpB [Polyangiaceae bacterium]|jgi:SsrA-binding protein|nr:SsrA-binding protein SmpB [Polyangiaceae bacterium]